MAAPFGPKGLAGVADCFSAKDALAGVSEAALFASTAADLRTSAFGSVVEDESVEGVCCSKAASAWRTSADLAGGVEPLTAGRSRTGDGRFFEHCDERSGKGVTSWTAWCAAATAVACVVFDSGNIPWSASRVSSSTSLACWILACRCLASSASAKESVAETGDRPEPEANGVSEDA